MVNSRDIKELYPEVAKKAQQLIDLCKKEHIDIILTSTYRDFESQDALYAQGRTAKGRIVTNARGGQSFHNFRVAFDVVPVVNGKAIWHDKNTWKKIGALGKSIGLEWAGDWRRFKEYPHFQYTKGLSLADFRAGKAKGGFF